MYPAPFKMRHFQNAMKSPLIRLCLFYFVGGGAILALCWLYIDPAVAKFLTLSWSAVGASLALITYGGHFKKDNAIAHFAYLAGFAWLVVLAIVGALQITNLDLSRPESHSVTAVADVTLMERINAAVPAEFSGQIVVSSADGILFSRSFGFADREAKIPVTDDMLFDIGSVTKTYSATAILKLAAEQKLGVDMSLSHWFEGLPELTGSITVHQLLSHTSGLPQYSGDDDEACDRSCFDTWLTTATLEFAPGEKYHYSNPGYSTLARIIEKASGKTYEDYVVDDLVTPLDAGPIGYLRFPESESYAVGYLDGQRMGMPQDLGWMDDGPPWHLRGNGGLLTSASGLHRWLRATADGRTLPAEWQSRQLERHAERGDGIGYGYGWVIIERPSGIEIDHTGGNGFFFADARWFRDQGLLLTITSNAFDRQQIQTLLKNLRIALDIASEES